MIPVSTESRAESLVKQLAWSATLSGTDQASIETCPFCQNTNGKFYINVSGGEKDGLWNCKKCGEEGNIYQLRERLGIRSAGVVSMQDTALAAQAPGPMPDFAVLNKRLCGEPNFGDALDYLFSRGLTIEVIDKLQIGAENFDGKMWVVIPYFDKAGKPLFYKARSVPPAEKAFRAPKGREAPLYNSSVIQPDMEELVITEGEMDCISLLSQGYTSVVGIPGAQTKKAAWIELLDRTQPKTVYLLYDRDKTGQDAAREIAARIGLDRVKNILLPDFGGKDINEYFMAGHTLEDFQQLKAEAKPFNVQGVQGVGDILQELREDILGRGADNPTYDSPWPSLNRRLGGIEPGDVVGIMAEGKVGKTTLALNWVDYFAIKGVPSFLYCQEMPPKRMVRKWVSCVTKTDDTPGRSQITVDSVSLALEIAANRSGDLLFGYTKSNKAEDVFETIRQAVRRYGIKVVCFDNLHMLINNITHSSQQASTISKGFKALAMELMIVILLIIQPNRVQDGQIVAARNAKDSSSIEKDVDSMICLHRNRIGKIKESEFHGFMDTEENFEPQLLVRVDLSRYSSGGTCTLYMDGATSTVRELSQSDMIPTTSVKGGPIPIENPIEV